MGGSQAGGEPVCGERVVKQEARMKPVIMKPVISVLVWIATMFCLVVAIVMIHPWYVPEPVQTVVEIDPEDVSDLMGTGIDSGIIVLYPSTVERDQLALTFPENAQGYYGDVMEVEGTGDLEIECGTLKFEDGKLVGMVGCGEVVMFTATDVWPEGKR